MSKVDAYDRLRAAVDKARNFWTAEEPTLCRLDLYPMGVHILMDFKNHDFHVSKLVLWEELETANADTLCMKMDRLYQRMLDRLRKAA